MIVIDCSILIASLMKDESSLYADEVLQSLSQGDLQAIVPHLFFIEAMNVVVSNVRRGRISRVELEEYVELLNEAPVTVDDQFNTRQSAKLALDHGLSVYDANYLEVTIRNNATLATLDKKLATISDKLGVAYKLH